MESVTLTLNLLMTTIVAPPSNASKWQMGFNSAFKGMHEKPTNTQLELVCLSCLRVERGGGICECGDEPSGSIKCVEFLTSYKLVSFSRRTLLVAVQLCY